MKSIKLLGLGLAVATALVFTACEDPFSKDSSSKNTSSLSFPANVTSAKPTLENGKKVEDATATNQIGGIPGLNSVHDNSRLNIALLSNKISKRLLKYTKEIDMQSYALNETFNEVDSCSQGGTMSFNMDRINSMTITATNCNDGYENINGSVYMTIKLSDVIEHTVKFITDFTITKVSDNSMAKILANSYMIGVTTIADEKKVTISLQATDGSELHGLQDCEFHYLETNNGNLEMYQTKGKVYIDNLAAYVDYDTSYDMSQTPFVFSGDEDTLISGEARYNMANNAKVKIKVESNEAKTYVDTNGDGVYELNE